MLPFDSVVMLTWSDWKTEPRSNRYHYATRFARHVPVLFVQPDGQPSEEEPSESPGISLLHVGRKYVSHQLLPVRHALARRGLSRPLVWSYNPFYRGVGRLFPRSLRVHHATEDYFSLQHYLRPPDAAKRLRERYFRRKLQSRLILWLRGTDLVVCVTPGVARAIVQRCGQRTPTLVLQNGCDYAFWRAHPAVEPSRPGRVAIYQGSINERLDARMIAQVMRRLPSWEFRFCGPVSPSFVQWREVSGQPNYRYLGVLRPDALAVALREAEVGLIPFIDYPGLSEQSLPLKAFEYVASGLPVVSTPIDTLVEFPSVFRIARTERQFAEAILEAGAKRDDPAELSARLETARAHDYERRFEQLLGTLAGLQRRSFTMEFAPLARAARFSVMSWCNGALALAAGLLSSRPTSR